MARWLVKTEPSTYSFARLRKDGRTVWDGVKNPAALKYLAQMRKGDAVLVYHTGSEKAVVGLARAVSDPYPDPDKKDSRLLVIELAPDQELPAPISLAAIQANAKLANFALVRQPRLSVMAVTDEQWKEMQACAARPTG